MRTQRQMLLVVPQIGFAQLHRLLYQLQNEEHYFPIQSRVAQGDLKTVH